MKQLLVLSFIVCPALVFAQDVIVKHDGSTILSKVTKIGTTEVEYKKFSNQNGPTYTILTSDILSINYENGEKESFADAAKSAKQEEEAKQQIVEAKPAADNAEIISRYNQTYEHGEAIKDKNKPADEALCILGVGENSVLSTEDVEIQFRQEPYEYGQKIGISSQSYHILWRFFVQIHNKTNNIIYVDLGSSFRVMKNGESKSYYETSEITINKGSASGSGINLGAIAGAAGIGGAIGTLANGVNVGGGNMSSTSKTYSKQRILAIPPKGSMPIEKYQRETFKRVGFNPVKFEVISDGELLLYGYADNEMPKIMRGEKYIYKEEESPYHADYMITYSKDTDFKDVSTLKASVFIRQLIGWNGWTDRSASNKDKLMKWCKEFIPSYNDYTIIGTFVKKKYADNIKEYLKNECEF